MRTFNIFTKMANLSDILTAPVYFRVSKIIHKALFGVTGKGIEAAATADENQSLFFSNSLLITCVVYITNL